MRILKSTIVCNTEGRKSNPSKDLDFTEITHNNWDREIGRDAQILYFSHAIGE